MRALSKPIETMPINVEEPKKERQPNPWLTHVKAFRSSHPDLSYKECLQQAATTYTKKEAPSQPAVA